MKLVQQSLGRSVSIRASTLQLVVACLAAVTVVPAHASWAGVEYFPTLQFNDTGPNFYDPANGLVPAGSENSVGLPVSIDGNYIQLIDPGHNRDAASFMLDDKSSENFEISSTVFSFSSASPWTQTFTSAVPGLFKSISLVKSGSPAQGFDMYPGSFSYGLSGDTITISWGGSKLNQGGAQNYLAGFHIGTVDDVPSVPSPVPEPGTHALMLGGLGVLGFAARRRKLIA